MSLDITWNHWKFISIGSIWDLPESNLQLRKILKPMGITIIVINQKKNKNPLKCTNIYKPQTLWSKSSKKDKEQNFEAKTVTKINL